MRDRVRRPPHPQVTDGPATPQATNDNNVPLSGVTVAAGLNAAHPACTVTSGTGNTIAASPGPRIPDDSHRYSQSFRQ